MVTLSNQSKLIDLSRYKRRWDLRLSGLSEEEGEDVRNKVISICQKTAPGCKEKLPDVINTVHRLGRVTGSARPREVIMQFSMRHYRDMIWKAAKQSSFLKTHNLRFKEDFSPEDRQRRNMLWPLVKKAREEGKTAFYIGPRAFVVDKGGMRKELEPSND
ncbi:hypothetical protein GOODEAATRI_031139 [Goodea atripinnis]|uniref:Uncharacterized protein n=1 Tax=Goodea atripinnis TaxID=208336 RepID=A0ABV0N6Q4_9TELE